MPDSVSEVIVIGTRSGGGIGFDSYTSVPVESASTLNTQIGEVLAQYNGDQLKADIVAGIRTEVLTTGVLTSASKALMRGMGLKLSDVLPPGVYQGEFDVILGAEHRQLIYIDQAGNSTLYTARPGDSTPGTPANDGRRLDVVVTSWESDDHGLMSDTEQRLFAVAGTQQDAALAAAMNASFQSSAAAIDNASLNYNFLLQNSNSVFNTLTDAADINPYKDGLAPGSSLDLASVIGGAQSQAFVLTDGGWGIQSGSINSDTIHGSATASSIDGGAGDDWIYGGSINDGIFGGDGADYIQSRGGYVSGGTGADVIVVIDGGSFILNGDAGDDSITGSSGGDYIDAGTGADTVSAGGGDDEIHLLEGADLGYGGGGADVIWGNAGADILYGEAGADRIFGGDDDDDLYGGDGDDILDGGVGYDDFVGGAGADTFMLNRIDSPIDIETFRSNTIWDFQTGVDKIDARQFAGASVMLWTTDGVTQVTVVGPNDFAFFMVTNAIVASDVLI